MKCLALIFVLVTVAVCATLERYPFHEIEDIPDSQDSRIIDGQNAVQGQFPYAVFIQAWFDRLRESMCGGSLINTRWVLTAAHCIHNAEMTRVYIGYINLFRPVSIDTVKVFTSDLFPHPDYNELNFGNDIGLIKLPNAVVPSGRIQIIRLAGSTQHLGDGVNVTISGWGTTVDDGEEIASSRLNYVTLTTVTQNECKDSFEDFVTDATICAIGQSKENICHKDNGGALVADDSDGNPYQVGIASFIYSHGCDLGKPSGYLRPEYYLDWIDETMRSNS